MQNDTRTISNKVDESISNQSLDSTEEKNDVDDLLSKNISIIDSSNKHAKKKPIYCQHIKWTKEEDDNLRQLVKKYGENNWMEISKNMGNRKIRQCRERWQNYLNPNLKIGNWTNEEDELILKKRYELGPKWKVIEKFFENRTDAMIKTRYNALIRDKERKIKKQILDSFIKTSRKKKKYNKRKSKKKYQNNYWDFLYQEEDNDDYLFEYDNEFSDNKYFIL